MLRADLMPRAHDTALEQGEGRFHGVRVNVAVDIDSFLVLDRLMPLSGDSSPVKREGVRGKLIGHNHVHICVYVVFDVRGQRARLRILSMEESEFPAALANTDDDFLC